MRAAAVITYHRRCTCSSKALRSCNWVGDSEACIRSAAREGKLCEIWHSRTSPKAAELLYLQRLPQYESHHVTVSDSFSSMIWLSSIYGSCTFPAFGAAATVRLLGAVFSNGLISLSPHVQFLPINSTLVHCNTARYRLVPSRLDRYPSIPSSPRASFDSAWRKRDGRTFARTSAHQTQLASLGTCQNTALRNISTEARLGS